MAYGISTFNFSRKEFIDYYMSRFQELEDKRIQMCYKIINDYEQMSKFDHKYMQEELEEVLNEQGIMQDSILKVSIVCAENLGPLEQSYVYVKHDGKEGRTKSKNGSQPIWNEAISFDVRDKEKLVTVQLVSAITGLILAEQKFHLGELVEYPEMQNEIKVIPEGANRTTDLCFVVRL